LAALIHRHDDLLSRVILTQNISALLSLFEVQPSAFWKTHYTFEKESIPKSKNLGEESAMNILINAVVPFLFIYGNMHGREDLKAKALELLASLPPEKNRIISRWTQAGIRPTSAFYSQGLLQLSGMFCNRRRCLACSLGTRLITSEAV
jgi:hypothetical protein